jgi:ABC-type phosphate/phosphonate transport system substrate-binding protein
MIANARMYSVSADAAALWRALLAALIDQSGLAVALVEHPEPLPMAALWRRTDKAAVFMCGLPYSLAEPRPILMAAPVPSPTEFNGEARYWSNLVVRADSSFRAVPDTFGRRIAFTAPESQSGYGAALHYFMSRAEGSRSERTPLFEEIVAPQITPLGALQAVLHGVAEIAPVDSYAFSLLQRFRPDLTAQVRIIGTTAPTPIPPLVASWSGLDALQSAFLEADRSAATKPIMERLMLQRFVRPDAASYEVLRHHFQAACRYWSERPLAALVHPMFALAPSALPPGGGMPLD